MMYSAYKLNKQGDKYSLDVLLFLFGTSLLFVSLGKFIPRYLILFVAMVNGIDSLMGLISLSDFHC